MSRVEKTRRVKRFAVLTALRHFVWEWRIQYNCCGIPESKCKKLSFIEEETQFRRNVATGKAKAIIAICSFQYHKEIEMNFSLWISVYLYGCSFWTFAVFVSYQLFIGFQFAMDVSFKWICKYMIPFMLKISICWGLTTIYIPLKPSFIML